MGVKHMSFSRHLHSLLFVIYSGYLCHNWKHLGVGGRNHSTVSEIINGYPVEIRELDSCSEFFFRFFYILYLRSEYFVL